ncbi:MAG: TraB/GumN family protein [Acidobacteriota bacterium]
MTTNETTSPEGASESPATGTAPLPKAVHTVTLGARTVHLVGTAHVSAESVEDVRQTLEATLPDTVCVELCEARFANIRDRDNWRKLDIFKILKEGKAALLLSSLVMTSFQKRIADELGVAPGAEMTEAIRISDERDLRLVLADRDIQTTLRRTWARLGFFARLKMVGQLVASLFAGGEIDKESIEQLKEEDQLSDMLEGLAKAFPSVKSTLIDERDTYLAQKVRDAGGETIVAVVGAGHVPGILAQIDEVQSLAPLDEVPPPSVWGKVIAWGIPALILGLFAYGFVRGGAEQSLASLNIWFLVNGAFSALGTACALGHPLAIVSAFVAAPLTSLNPFVAAGWVAGLVQAWVKRPKVADLEALPEDITSVRGFFRNPVSRILLVVVLANLGSTLGTVVAGSWIAASTL